MTFWLRHFPILQRPKRTRSYTSLGNTNDRWHGTSPITIKERDWDGLASITLRVGRQNITFYSSSIRELHVSLRQIPDRIDRRDFLPTSGTGFGGFSLVYNYAHPVASRGRVLDSVHPTNSLYSNSLDAVFHADGAVSAVASSKRPWHVMQVAFAPGFFDGIQRYLAKVQIQVQERSATEL
jgi:hypothetical protein